MASIIRINTRLKQVKMESVPERYKWHGGRELTATILHNEVDPSADALGPDNKLIFATGLLAGTSAPNHSRISAGGKSPLTGGIKESNVGGSAGFLLGQHEIRAIVLEDAPRDSRTFSHVIINNKGASFEDANDDMLLGNYALARKMARTRGKGASMISIGPAGVHQSLMASIAVLDLQGYPSRHAGRGGLGAVMGSKGIKSIVIQKKSGTRHLYNDKSEFKQVAGAWAKQLKTTKAGFSTLGTAMTVGISQTLKGLPTRNFRKGTFNGADKIGGDALHELILKRGGKFGLPCLPGCAIQCSNLVIGPDGKHVTSSLEYETICLNGSNLMIDDLDTIARIDGGCDDIGVDTIEFGVMMGVLMESGTYEFGDKLAPFEVLEEIRRGTERGELYGSGATKVGKKLGVKRVPAVKGQGMAAYDPRVYKGMGVTFSTTPMGADHTAGAAIYKRPGLDPEFDYGDVSGNAGKLKLSYELQVLTGALDMLGACYFIGPSKDSLVKDAKLLKARYGWNEVTWEVLFEKAKEMIRVELAFNKGAGITTDKNDVPDFFRTEKSEPTGLTWDYPREKLQDFWKNRL
ncbi:MAG: aldehyde ferredoxin oxidoreductase C-terminal domain-containing protein [Promethearchaeota archaeon]